MEVVSILQRRIILLLIVSPNFFQYKQRSTNQVLRLISLASESAKFTNALRIPYFEFDKKL